MGSYGNWIARVGLNLSSTVAKSLVRNAVGVVALKRARIHGGLSGADPFERSSCRLYEVRQHDPSIPGYFAQERDAVDTGYFFPAYRRIIGVQTRG